MSKDKVIHLTEKSQSPKRWARHFQGDLKHSLTICEEARNRLPAVGTNDDRPPSFFEAVKVYNSCPGKSTGIKCNSSRLTAHGKAYFGIHGMVVKRTHSEDFKDVPIAYVLERNAKWWLSDNQRCASYLSTSPVLLPNLPMHLENSLSENRSADSGNTMEPRA
nr:unnamed protein product [Spirometra erinaceieuropaei]